MLFSAPDHQHWLQKQERGFPFHISVQTKAYFFYWTGEHGDPHTVWHTKLGYVYSTDETTNKRSFALILPGEFNGLHIFMVYCYFGGSVFRFFHLLAVLLANAGLLVTGIEHHSRGGQSHKKFSPTCGLKQSCPVWDFKQVKLK